MTESTEKKEQAMNEEEFLENYDPSKYPIVMVTSDVVALSLINGKLSVLLVQRLGHPFQGMWALPGGFFGEDETLEESALRELMEETQTGAWVEQLKTYGDPGRDPRGRVVTVAYVSIVPNPEKPTAGSDAAHARWWAVEDLAVENSDGMKLAFDHEKIIADGIERARAKLEYTTIGTSFLEEPFTIADLRRVYEAVWGMELNQGNFWTKVLKVAGFVESTGAKAKPKGKGAPGELYVRGSRTDELFPPIRRNGL